MSPMLEHLLSMHEAVHSFLITATNHQPIISKHQAENKISQPDEVYPGKKPTTSITIDSKDWFSLRIRNKT